MNSSKLMQDKKVKVEDVQKSNSENKSDQTEVINYIEIDIPPFNSEDDCAEFANNDEYEEEEMLYESDSCESNDIKIQNHNVQRYIEINIPCIKPGFVKARVIDESKKIHPCKFCPEKFPSLLSLKGHIGTHGNYQCKICLKRFLKPHYLKAHMSSHNEQKAYKCDKCTESFIHAISLRAHQVVHSDKPKVHKCDKCGKEFSRINRLHTHKLIHGVERTFKCSICEKVLKSLKEYRAHKLLHSYERRFECNICHKKFKRQTILDSHKMCHTNERPFKCDKCPKQYTVICNLKRHRLTHIPEKPCDECGKTFTIISDLKRHKYEHLGYNPFECDICHKIFTQSCDLRKHQVIHSGMKPFECKVCLKKFTSSSNMNKHLKTLHADYIKEENTKAIEQVEETVSEFIEPVTEGVKMDFSLGNSTESNVIYVKKQYMTPFQCDVCSKYFVSISNMNKHKKLIHLVDPINYQL